MPPNLIHGPLNSGRAGLLRRRFIGALDRSPVLVVPTLDDVFEFERELCEGGAALGGSVMTFGALFNLVATAGGSPPSAELTPAQRLRAVSVAIAERQEGLGALRRSAARPGFAIAFERLLDELQAAGVEPGAVEAAAGTLEGSAYLSDLSNLYAGYVEVRDRLGMVDSHGVAREAIALLHRSGDFWGGRPLFLYGLDDLTPSQLELIRALSASADVTVALPYEEGRAALAARATLLLRLREGLEVAEEIATDADAGNTPNPLLFHLERNFGAGDPDRHPPGEGLVLLRSAGERGEAEAIAVEAAKLIAAGSDPAEIAIALRDPARRGPPIAEVLESYGVPTALEVEVPVTGTAVGGALVALLEAEFGAGRASDLVRFLRGPSGISPRRVDWLERSIRQSRTQTAAAALELWEGEKGGEPPFDLARIREAASRSPAELAAEVGRLATTMASRHLRGEQDGPRPGAGDGLELRAAATISKALAELGELDGLAPAAEELAATIAGLEFRVWSGPVEGRVRVASPYRLRAARFDHVFVGSLQDGEFPRYDRGGDPFLSQRQRASLGLDPRQDADAEERYLFYVCISLAKERLFLSYRDSDEKGTATARSPLLDDVRRLLDTPPGGEPPDPVEESITRGRDLAQVVQAVTEAPSEDELARAIAARGTSESPAAALAVAGAGDEVSARVSARIEAARAAEAASRAPGPLRNPAVLASLAAVPAYGGTTLEEFDLCSYRWFAGHELDPQPLDPVPEPLLQGGLMHTALDRLYKERPGGDTLPRPGSLDAWVTRGRALLAELAAERGLGKHPAERTIVRRVERLLVRFLGEEAERETGGFEPWLLEASFGEEAENERPVLDLGGWGLHGAIDRVDRDPSGRALVLDYKLSGSVTPRGKFEEQAKLQLPLYLIAVAEHWGAEPVAGLYHPLRATSARRPRGVVHDEAAGDLSSYGLYEADVVGGEEFEAVLDESRERASEIVARVRAGDIRRDPGPRQGLRGHDICPRFCTFAPICRRDRAPVTEEDEEVEER